MTAPALIDTIAPEIKVNGTLLPALVLDQISGVRISAGLNLPSRAELHFKDLQFSVSADTTFAVGNEIAIAVAGQSDSIIFEGEVTGVELDLGQDVHEFTVIAHDKSARLTLASKVRSFSMQTYSNVVSTIASEAGLRADIDATTEQHEYILQADTDYGFLCELASRMGYDWWVSGKSLNFKESKVEGGSPIALTFGEQLRQFSVRANALHPNGTKVQGWSSKAKNSVVGTGVMTRVGNLPDAALVTPFVNGLVAGSQSQLAADAAQSQQEAEELADRTVARWAQGASVARGTCVINSAITPRSTVQVHQVGPASGSYLVTEVEHTYSLRGFETRFVAGDRRPRALVDTLSGGPRSTSFKIDGLVIGLVTQVGNPNGSPGDVKVSYPGVVDQLASNWARIVTVGGGSARGMTFVPEINDEVIVGFESGDPRRPLVLGGLFNSRDAQPAFRYANNKVATRQITSRLGHAIEFGDGETDVDKYIGLSLAGGRKLIKLGEQGLEATVPSGTPIRLKSGQSLIEMNEQGEITLSGQKITLKSNTDVQISGMNVTTTANAKVATSGAIVQLKANGQAEVSAAGPVMVSGNPVLVN